MPPTGINFSASKQCSVYTDPTALPVCACNRMFYGDDCSINYVDTMKTPSMHVRAAGFHNWAAAIPMTSNAENLWSIEIPAKTLINFDNCNNDGDCFNPIRFDVFGDGKEMYGCSHRGNNSISKLASTTPCCNAFFNYSTPKNIQCVHLAILIRDSMMALVHRWYGLYAR